MEINAARIAASFHLGLDSAILKLLKNGLGNNGYSNYNKLEETKYIYHQSVYFTRIGNFTWGVPECEELVGITHI